MQRSEEHRPRQECHAPCPHGQFVAKEAGVSGNRSHKELMMSQEACRAVEAKPHQTSRFVVFDDVAHRPVAAGGSDLKLPVESHGGPFSAGPQEVVAAGQGIDERPDGVRGSGNDAFMHVADHEVMLLPESFSEGAVRLWRPRVEDPWRYR